MAITKVSPALIQVANNVTSTTIGNTTSIPSLTFDASGVIISASNTTVTVANTNITGTITTAQLGTGVVSNTKIASGAVEQYFADTGYETQFRNRIINGDMRIAQRGTSDTIDGGGWDYLIDRFCALGQSAAGVFTYSQDSDSPTGFQKSLKVEVTTADGTLASGDIYTIRHTIEGFNTADLNWGTANAKTITLSFWVRSSLTGTFGGALNNEGARSYPFSYSISVADTWEYKTITIAGDTSGTWGTTNSHGIRVTWGLGVGTTYSGTAGAWAGSEYFSATGAVSVIGTLNATWYITGVQLEVGSVATPFERRDYGRELSLCMRYFEVGSIIVQGNIVIGGNFAVPKRALPTMVRTANFYASASAGSVITAAGGTVGPSTNNVGGVSYYSESGGNGYSGGIWTASAEL